MASNIRGITVEIGGNVGPLQKALESVNKTIKSTGSELKDIERLLKLDPTNTELLAQKQEKLKTAISAVKEKLDALKIAQEQAKQQMESGDLGKDKYDALQREIISAEEQLKKLAQEAANANTALNKMSSVGKTMQSVGNSMTSVGKSLTAYVTAPILAVGTAAVKTAADFDSEMSKVKAISGATGKDFAELRDKAREMGAKTKFSATEAAEAMSYMGMAGWKTGDMLNGIEGIMNLAAASGENLASTSDIVTDALTAFGLEAKDSGHFADVLAAASTNANTNVSMLGESFKYAAPVVGALGGTAEDASIALGLMANAGIKGSEAGSSLRTSLTNLVKPSKQMEAAMKAYSIEIQKNADGSVNLRETMNHLRTQMGQLSETEQAAAAAAIFGKNSMAGWLAIINASDKDFNKLTTAIDNCDGQAEKMAETMQDNLNGQITILKSALQELAIQIGDALMPTIRNVVSKIQEWVQKLQQMDEGTRNTILKISGLAAAIGSLLIIIGTLTSAIGKGISAFANLGKGILTLVEQANLGVGAGGAVANALSALTGSIGLVIAAVAALVAGFITLWNTNEEFRNAVKLIWSQVVAAFREMEEEIFSVLQGLGVDIKNFGELFSAIWTELCNALAPLLKAAFETICKILETVFGVITGLLKTFAGLFKGDWDQMLEGIQQIFQSIWDGIAGIFSTVLESLRTYLDAFLAYFGTNWEQCWQGIKDTCSAIGTGIKDFVVGVFQVMSDTVMAILNGLWGFIKTVWNGIWGSISWVLDLMGLGAKAAFADTTENIQTETNKQESFLSQKWNEIKTSVSTTVETLKTAISDKWEALKTSLSTTVENIKTAISQKWEALKTSLSTTVETIKTVISEKWTAIKTALSTTVDAIKAGITEKWTAIRTSLTTTVDIIKTTVSQKWEALKTSVSNTVEVLKTVVSQKWENLKSSLTTATQTLETAISQKWSALKTSLQTLTEGIKTSTTQAWTALTTSVRQLNETIATTLSQKWTAIKTSLTQTMEGIKTSITEKWTTISTGVSQIFQRIGSSTTQAWNGIKTSITTSVTGIKTSITQGFQAALVSVTQIFTNIKTKITSIMDSAKNAVANAITAIKGKFNFSWSLPKIKLPHVSITGSFSLNPPSVPHFNISWYKKAMENGMILNSPTIFGMKGNSLLAGGEAGSEAVVGTQSLMEMIRDAVNSIAGGTTINYGGVNINVYQKENQDIRALADEIEYRINNSVMRRRAAAGT